MPQNYAEAARWLRLAAGQGDAIGQMYLGIMYANGSGVPQNHVEAMRLLQLAADQGDALAQHNLGVGYENGLGVLQNYETAYMWFNLAAAQAYQSARTARERLASRMKPAQISRAQQRSEACMARNYQGC